MTLKFWCARCGRAMYAGADQAGKAATCAGCGYAQSVPAAVRHETGDGGNGGPGMEPKAGVYQFAAPPLERPGTRAGARELTEGPVRSPKDVLWDVIHGIALDHSRLQLPSLMLICLSIADILVTFRLLRISQAYYESNPVAYWFFSRWDMRGMIAFKFSSIALAIVAGEIIERRRPGLGRLVLWVGSVAATAVVWHGFRLYMGLPGLPIPGGRE